MFTKPLVLTALLSQGVSAIEYPDKPGACPFKAGELSSNVAGSLDTNRIDGRWINIYDRQTLNDNHECYGVKFTPNHSDGASSRVFEYLKASR